MGSSFIIVKTIIRQNKAMVSNVLIPKVAIITDLLVAGITQTCSAAKISPLSCDYVTDVTLTLKKKTTGINENILLQ